MQIKVEALGHRKKLVKQVVSSGAPRQFHKLLSCGLKMIAERNLRITTGKLLLKTEKQEDIC